MSHIAQGLSYWMYLHTQLCTERKSRSLVQSRVGAEDISKESINKKGSAHCWNLIEWHMSMIAKAGEQSMELS